MARELQIINSDIVSYADTFRVDPADCENPEHYESYLKQSALSDLKSGQGVTYVLTEDCNILGYVTIKASSLIFNDGESHRKGNPAIEISELAVNMNYKRQQIGYELVEAAILIGQNLSSGVLGIKYLVLCADPCAVEFYEKPRLGLKRLDQISDIPREEWNMSCVPMSKKIVIN